VAGILLNVALTWLTWTPGLRAFLFVLFPHRKRQGATPALLWPNVAIFRSSERVRRVANPWIQPS